MNTKQIKLNELSPGDKFYYNDQLHMVLPTMRFWGDDYGREYYLVKPNNVDCFSNGELHNVCLNLVTMSYVFFNKFEWVDVYESN